MSKTIIIMIILLYTINIYHRGVVNNYGQGGGGWNMGPIKDFGELKGAQHFLKVHMGGGMKHFELFYLKYGG